MRPAVHDDLRNHAEQEIPDEADGEPEACPIVSIFHDLQTVAIELHIPVKVHLVEGLHGNLGPAMVLGLIGGLLEGEVVLDGAAGESGLLVEAGADGRD